MLEPKYNFEFTDIDKLREIIADKHKQYNYLCIFSMILFILSIILCIIFAILNSHVLCFTFFFLFTTSFISIHICCNVYKNHNIVFDYLFITS